MSVRGKVIKALIRSTSRLVGGRPSPPDTLLRQLRVKRILVISLTHLGDAVLLLPFLRHIRKAHPTARVDIVVKQGVADALKACPYVDNILVFNAPWVMPGGRGDTLVAFLRFVRRIRSGGYELALVTHPHVLSHVLAWAGRIPVRVGYSDGNERFLNVRVPPAQGVQHAVQQALELLRFLGWGTPSTELELHLTSADRLFAGRVASSISSRGATSILGVHPGAGITEKCWRSEGFATTIDWMIQRHGVHVLLMGGPRERAIVDKIVRRLAGETKQAHITNLCGKTTLGELAAVMGICDVVLANDSGPMHIADCMHRPLVAIFTSRDPSATAVWGPLGHPRSAALSCAGEEEGDGAFRISVERVIQTLESILITHRSERPVEHNTENRRDHVSERK